ncbi:MAG TPA: class I SAM-dependent methyltransferase, partial [Bacteroidia bacterium]|nr:class I SAM-dependent methyltransferase [Bacteroidia bacterium]
METISNCPICNKNLFTPFITCTDYTVSQKDFQIVTCNECSFKFTNPKPTNEDLGSYYKSNDYISHTNSDKGWFNKLYKTVRNYTIDKKVKALSKYNAPSKTLLDIGCGTGEFLNAAKIKQWHVTGLEPGVDARNLAIKNYGLHVFDIDHLAKLKPQSFDVITMWHVLEHIPNLHETIKQLKQILAPNGTLIVAVPNSNAIEAKNFGRFWAAYDVPRHLNHFSAKNVINLLKINNLDVCSTKPMIFDPFYIAMLSAKYQNKSPFFGLVLGIYHGLRTNVF